jgi:serine/threonine-protein kinase TNNI3K
MPLCYDRSEDALYSGGYSDVWMGEYDGRKVAVKVLRIYTTSNLRKVTSVGRSFSFPIANIKLLIPTAQRFCKEVMTWKSLRHPNVLPLMGVTMRGKHFSMVSEWMFNGSINEYIKANRDADRFELVGCHPFFTVPSTDDAV